MPAHRNSTVCTDEQDTTASSGGVPDQGGAPRLGAGVEDVPWEEGRGWLGNQLGKVGAGAGVLAPRQPGGRFFAGLQANRESTAWSVGVILVMSA